MAIFSFQNVGAQLLNLVHEEFIAERTLGKKAFIQADFNGDGEMEFLADAKKFNLDIDIATPDEVQRLLAEFANYPKSVIDRAKAAIGR